MLSQKCRHLFNHLLNNCRHLQNHCGHLFHHCRHLFHHYRHRFNHCCHLFNHCCHLFNHCRHLFNHHYGQIWHHSGCHIVWLTIQFINKLALYGVKYTEYTAAFDLPVEKRRSNQSEKGTGDPAPAVTIVQGHLQELARDDNNDDERELNSAEFGEASSSRKDHTASHATRIAVLRANPPGPSIFWNALRECFRQSILYVPKA